MDVSYFYDDLLSLFLGRSQYSRRSPIDGVNRSKRGKKSKSK